MKVLWLINIPLPEVNSLMGEKSSPSGGWLVNASKKLAERKEVSLTIAFPKKGVKETIKLNGEKITYNAFKPMKLHDEKLKRDNFIFEDIISEANPDIVHIFGTEFAHTLSMVNTCEKKGIKTVISIQGLVSVIGKHMFNNLPFKAVYGCTIRNIIRRDNVFQLQKSFYKRGINEIQAIKKVNHIIGRTTWDKACTSQINPNAEYYHCNETLREEFYKHKWDINYSEKHSIFVSQGQYPIKGLHNVLQAMPIILEKYPDTKLYIGGKDITKSKTIKDKLLTTYYGKYIKKLINKNKLESAVIFTGPLDEKKMCKKHLNSHVFVSPSSIENSPNSLGEAMILGVPSVASYVGGVPDMLSHEKEGYLYQADAPYMLAHYVCKIFGNDDLAMKVSNKARTRALKTHDSEKNTNRLMEIYDDIIKK